MTKKLLYFFTIYFICIPKKMFQFLNFRNRLIKKYKKMAERFDDKLTQLVKKFHFMEPGLISDILNQVYFIYLFKKALFDPFL